MAIRALVSYVLQLIGEGKIVPENMCEGTQMPVCSHMYRLEIAAAAEQLR